jgi:hypothetical protein
MIEQVSDNISLAEAYLFVLVVTSNNKHSIYIIEENINVTISIVFIMLYIFV